MASAQVSNQASKRPAANRTSLARSRAGTRRRPRIRALGPNWLPNPEIPDPLDPGHASRKIGLTSWASSLLAALVIHASLFSLTMLLSSLHGDDADRRPEQAERVELRVVEPTPPRPPVEAEAAMAPAPVPRERRTEKPVAEIPPDPVDLPPAPELEAAPTPPPKQRRIVGLSFASTVSGGSGPAYAVGNTRMGSTAARAADPAEAKPLPKNRLAARNPTEGGTFTKPRRVSPIEPDYPELLRTRGIEANVVVFVRIAADGSVEEARIVKASSHPELNRSALAAARAQQYAPATLNGVPLKHSLEYTYRFRLDRT